MSSVHRLIAILALVPAALPLPATATVLNGMKVIWQVDTARTILDKAVAGCPSITNASLQEECRSYSQALRSSIELWESNFSAGTLTVAFDANTEATIYSDEVALKNIASSAGFSASATNSARPPLELATDELDAAEPLDAAGCDACFTQARNAAIDCALNTMGSLICLVNLVNDVITCGNSKACTEPPNPPKACPTS